MQPKKKAKNRHPSVPSKIYVYEIQPRQGLFPSLSLGLESFDANIVVSFEVYFVAGFRAVGFLGNQPDTAFKGAVGSVEALALRELAFCLFQLLVCHGGVCLLCFVVHMIALKAHYSKAILRYIPA
jgi:hypothetical protein